MIAAHLLYVATEEHPVWTIRSYSPHQQALASEWLKDGTLRDETLGALRRGLQAGTRFSGDTVRRAMEMRAREQAYYALGNVVYRQWRPEAIRPDLERLLGAEDESSRLMARNLLQDLFSVER